MKRYIKADIADILDEDLDLKVDLARKTSTRPATLAQLANASEVVVREAVACNPNTPISTLKLLAADPAINVRDCVVRQAHQRINFPKDILDILAADSSLHIRDYTWYVLYNVYNEDITDVINGLEDTAMFCARRVDTEPRLLTKLASHPGRYVRYLVAKNPTTPSDTLTQLASGSDRDVKHAVADNPNASEEALLKLMDSKNRNIRYLWEEVLDNPNVTANVLLAGLRKHDDELRQTIASIEDAPEEVLRAAFKYPCTWSKLISNPSTPSDILAKLVKSILTDSANLGYLNRLLKHPNTPIESIEYIINNVQQLYSDPEDAEFAQERAQLWLSKRTTQSE